MTLCAPTGIERACRNPPLSTSCTQCHVRVETRGILCCPWGPFCCCCLTHRTPNGAPPTGHSEQYSIPTPLALGYYAHDQSTNQVSDIVVYCNLTHTATAIASSTARHGTVLSWKRRARGSRVVTGRVVFSSHPVLTGMQRCGHIDRFYLRSTTLRGQGRLSLGFHTAAGGQGCA